MYPGKTVKDPESAVYDPAGDPYPVNYSSGGGFSNIYPVPQYQQSAVSTFFEKYDPPYPYYSVLSSDTGNIQQLPDVGALAGSSGGIYNRIGRGFPDVAANGDNIAVRLRVYESSASHPLSLVYHSRSTLPVIIRWMLVLQPVHRYLRQ